MNWWSIVLIAVGIFCVAQPLPSIIRSLRWQEVKVNDKYIERWAVGLTFIFIGIMV